MVNKLSKTEKIEVIKEIDKRIKQKVVSEAHAVKSEFKKQVSTAILAAFGLIIAFAWKDVITYYINKINIFNGQGLLASAILLTIISVIGIMIITKWNSPKETK